MKKNLLGIMAALITLAFLAVPACKKADEQKGATHAPVLTPEQKKQAEIVKKGIEESKKIVVARVNGAEITMSVIIRAMNKLAPRYIKEGQPATPEITEKIKKATIDRAIFEELAVQEAIRQGINVKPETVNNVIKNLKTQLGSEKAYKEYLGNAGLTEDGLKKQIERSHRFELITAKEIYQKIQPDEKKMRDKYEKNKDKFAVRTSKNAPPKQMTFEESRDIIERMLKAEIGEKRIKEWDSELRKNAKIEVLRGDGVN
ncbi:MAG: SurA N-terminal domain-containing protein [Nitrospirae bacterium]|nr:SurA N-terminal domain-containing protein [Nitrospirota bacterium]